MLYLATLYALLGTGLAASVGFVVLHRPRHFFRVTEINASWWVIIVGLGYARSCVLLGIRGDLPSHEWWDVALSLGLLSAIDALLLVRFFSYLLYRRQHPEKPPAAS
ncbi:hypothetical protein ABZ454_10865 [Streptomyces sp. NPDC005803]|uniref:hypothetical protein n=1 Tax=Streptomyces sp. NPDC005803 TaxID=3154297 RepID=UPI003402A2A9